MKTRFESRACGDAAKRCSECCFTHQIDAIEKKMYVRCDHSCTQGCQIYASRPIECISYLCMWRMGCFAENERPDTTGVVCDICIEEGVRIIRMIESRPGALKGDWATRMTRKSLQNDLPVYHIPITPPGQFLIPPSSKLSLNVRYRYAAFDDAVRVVSADEYEVAPAE